MVRPAPKRPLIPLSGSPAGDTGFFSPFACHTSYEPDCPSLRTVTPGFGWRSPRPLLVYIAVGRPPLLESSALKVQSRLPALLHCLQAGRAFPSL